MGAPKPCLGYRSRTEAIKALRAEGHSTAEIAARIGISNKDVISLEACAKRYRSTHPAAAQEQCGVMLPPWLIAALAPHAKRRSVKPGFLAFRIVETVVTEGMIDNVLDDLSEEKAA